MIRETTVYRTSDGKNFDDDGKALEYVADKIREVIAARLDPLTKAGKFSANDVYRIVMAIVPDAEVAKSLHAQIARWVDF